MAEMTPTKADAGQSTPDRPAPVAGRFRKRPHEVFAARWWQNGDHPADGTPASIVDRAGDETHEGLEGRIVRLFCHPEVPGNTVCQMCGHVMHVHGWIDTLEGGHVVCPGDWIVTGILGERYPVKPDIFELTYEPVTVS